MSSDFLGRGNNEVEVSLYVLSAVLRNSKDRRNECIEWTRRGMQGN